MWPAGRGLGMPGVRLLPGMAPLEAAASKHRQLYMRAMGQVLVDGHPSVNLVAMYSLDGQGADRNVFSNTWSHYVARPRSAPLRVVGAAFHLSLPLISGQPAGRCAPGCVHAPHLPSAWPACASA